MVPMQQPGSGAGGGGGVRFRAGSGVGEWLHPAKVRKWLWGKWWRFRAGRVAPPSQGRKWLWGKWFHGPMQQPW